MWHGQECKDLDMGPQGQRVCTCGGAGAHVIEWVRPNGLRIAM